MGIDDQQVAPSTSVSELKQLWQGSKTFTFYSFKGGVGRSMAMVNVAEILRRRGLNVLLVDFDLEAPGLDRYLDSPGALHKSADVLNKRGVIDMIISYKELRALPRLTPPPAESAQQEQSSSAFPFPVEPITNFVVPIYPQTPDRGALSLIPSGRRAGDEFVRYADRVRNFNWDDFYTNWNGEQFFDWFRTVAGQIADVVLIDSRTGVTEVSGVCTYQLADVVVMFVAPNQQNLEGTRMVARSLSNPALIEEGRNGRPLTLVCVPSRVEQGEAKLQDAFASQFESMLGEFFPSELRSSFEKSAFIDLKIPYVPYYAYMENVATRENSPSASEMVKAFERLASTLTRIGATPSTTLESAVAPAAAMLTPTTPTTPAGPTISAWIVDVEAGEPLQPGTRYELKVGIGDPRADARGAVAFDIAKVFQGLPEDQKTVQVLALLETDDFTIVGDDQQTITMPRTGASKSNADFMIETKRNGQCAIKVFFYANRRVFQKMTINLQVGAALAISASGGLPMASAIAMLPRRQDEVVNLIITKLEDGYQFTLKHSSVMTARINLSEAQLDELNSRVRKALKDIVYLQVNNQYIYMLEDTGIPPNIHHTTLKSLARVGFYLYQQLFFAPGNGRDAHAMGTLLRQLSRRQQLHIQIHAGRFFFPWSLLYDQDILNLDSIEPEGFWGFKHIVEYLPLFSQVQANSSAQIRVNDQLQIGFVYNTTMDTQFRRPIVASQREFLSSLPGVTVLEYPTTQELLRLLNTVDTPAQILYFYCHSASYLPGEKDGVAASKIVLSDGSITLEDLNILAPVAHQPLKEAPLVFLNGEQTSKISPYMYDGLIPYFFSKGARAVIGTEADMPAIFAAEFAGQLLARFTRGGQPIGELLRDLRREYLFERNNILGLTYVYFGDVSVIVERDRP